MANIFDACKRILSHYRYGLSTMKLQKLAYFSQGWSLAVTGDPLFSEDFEAWRNGPVCRELFNYHRALWSVQAEKLTLGSVMRLAEWQKAVIDEVVDIYGNLSGEELSGLTHIPGSPWDITRAGVPDGEACSAVIDKGLIKRAFLVELGLDDVGSLSV